MTDPKSMDMRQLRVLMSLLETRSVTRTAQALDLTQPYVSLVLRRLRDTTGDQILVRSGAGLVPTERGLAMVEPLAEVLRGLDRVVGGPAAFDPQTASGEFCIASADCMVAMLLPPLIAGLRAAAPGVRVSVRAVVRSYDYASALESGELDLVICNWAGQPQHLKTAHLMTEDVVCMFGPEHPFVGRETLTLEDYLRRSTSRRWHGRRPTRDRSTASWRPPGIGATSGSWCRSSTSSRIS